MFRKMKLVAVLAALALLLTGCVDYSSVVEGMMGEIESEANAEPTATVAPLAFDVYTDIPAVYQYYNQVSFGQSYDDLVALFGEPTEVIEHTEGNKSYLWQMEDGYGVSAAFFDGGLLRAKAVYYDDVRQFKTISSAKKLSNMSLLSSDDTYAIVNAALDGTALELMQLAADSSLSPDISKLYAWLSADGSIVQVLFDKDQKVQSINYQFEPEYEKADD